MRKEEDDDDDDECEWERVFYIVFTIFCNSVSALTRTIVGWQFSHVINFITAQQKEGKERSYIVPHRSREYKHRWHYI